MVWTDRGDAKAGGITLDRATVDPVAGQRQVVSSGYDEAIGVTAASLSTFDVSDLAGIIRHVDLTTPVPHRRVVGPGVQVGRVMS